MKPNDIKIPPKKQRRDAQYHYCVLYTPTLKQWKVYHTLKNSLPEGEGIVFYPCVELWWNDRVNTVIRPLFPGYIFIRSKLTQRQLHDLVLNSRNEILAFVKELTAPEQWKDNSTGDDTEEDFLLDLSEDESAFLDFILELSGSDANASPSSDKPSGDPSAEMEKIPESGVLRMSHGYEENGKITIMDGPLRGYEDRIIRVDKRKRKAILDISINGHIAKAGLVILGKRHWFPDDENASEILSDGTEIDPYEIARRMGQNSDSRQRRKR